MLVYSSNGADFPTSTYTYTGGIFEFKSYKEYWLGLMTNIVKLKCTFNSFIPETVESPDLDLYTCSYY